MRNIQTKLTTIIPVALLALLSGLNSQVSTLFAQGTAFTFQGRLGLLASGNPVTGSYDMTFAIFDHEMGAAQVGATFPLAAVAVNNGLFTVTLDFGPGIFTGPPRWVEIAVRASGTADPYTTIPPRAAFTASPYAIFAGSAGGVAASSIATGSLQNNSVTAAKIALPLSLSGSGDDLLSVTSGDGTAARFTGGANSFGVYGSGGFAGVYGTTASDIGFGVYGVNANGGSGVHGFCAGGNGVYGRGVRGVYGEAAVNGGIGVFGYNANGGSGVHGFSASGDGVNGVGKNGVHGASSSASDSGVWGENTGNGTGVAGSSVGGPGIYGHSTLGQAGYFDGDVGITGNESFGNRTRQMLDLYGTAYGIGVQNYTLYQRTDGGFNGGFAWYQGGTHSDNERDPGSGGTTLMHLGYDGEPVVLTVSGPISGTGRDFLPAVFGESVSGSADGVAGVSEGSGAGVQGVAIGGSAIAGYFHGKVEITTDLTVSGNKFFRIDHPLDPTNKYLLHSCVESPDVKNIYDGNVTTDANAEAIVTLPTYFEALNRDFRYQLTVIGQFAQAIVSSKVKGNQFTIKTDKPNVEVSWQVTGIRQDAYVKTHPMVVEQDKPANERGTYQHPELFGQPEEKGLSWSRNPEFWKRLKEKRGNQAAVTTP